MSSTTFNSIAKILETEFHLEPAVIQPDAALADLGLDSLALMEFVFAVEDAFRLRIPEERLDPREAGITLQRLCEVIDQMELEPRSALAPTA
ncbi:MULTISPECIES: acyl carrier protein [unclassified Variovorax]|uniref:acyl carrier protein n=1 Tax=unclassified Variovorax TaxID=663243 RepID=UPI001318D8A2|nr:MULTISPECIES: acyl carrier protein [unclassified Variovorax]VTU12786.1 Acyl carrier protein AcpXL [Variovorax sp. SRS16]VTU16044.1 Acyl carrier protein AcpXL [Variovorax sp. PBL-E5]